tara:strand:- start:7605 stop:8903 length:1299 start_codon:yes stop_codon:yes gene_type:complete
MKRLINPSKEQWLILSQRPQFKAEQIRTQVQEIMAKVEVEGDAALYEYSRLFDNYQGDLKLSERELKEASSLVAEPLKAAIQLAYRNIYSFHQAQQRNSEKIETSLGVHCWRESRPIEKVGLYIPGGSAPLFSTVLMLGIPAQIAAVPQKVLCSPADRNGNLNPAIIYTAQLCGITEIYKLGGAQAIAALSFGTETIPRVDKLFGPGNAYVTAAKQEALNFGLAIDMPAGPSEVLVIADAHAKPAFVAADLLSQAEHGPDSQVVLCTNSPELIKAVSLEIKEQLQNLSRASVAQKALENSLAISFDNLSDCIAFSNIYAPEHLIINCLEAKSLLPEIQNAGSVFVGPYSAESIGDYASGTNHTLPTAAYARSYSGLSLDSFQKQISFQEVSAEGLQNIGPAVALMAAAEELSAHKSAVDIRLESLRTAKDGI